MHKLPKITRELFAWVLCTWRLLASSLVRAEGDHRQNHEPAKKYSQGRILADTIMYGSKILPVKVGFCTVNGVGEA